jgi:outer membrane receptor for ferrienterochelin and colicin
MRFIIFTIFIFTSFTEIFGQPPNPTKTPKSIKGKVIEKNQQIPIEYATVAVLKADTDEVITAMLSNEKGEFDLELPAETQNIVLEITYVGFKTVQNSIDIRKTSGVHQVGNIYLEPDMQLLDEVLVTAEQSTMNLYVDRKVYNVDKDISARGGTGEDVLKNIPSVEIDAEGNVSVRNSSAQVFVDGRPSTLDVDKIPADQIEAVEVITNPSAKFDASSSGGIINIRLKKNKKPGYNGTVSAGIGTTDRYTALVNLNANKGPINIGANYSFNNVGNNVNTFVNRQTISNGILGESFRQDNSLYNSRLFNNARLNVDYQLNKTDLISLTLNYSNGRFGSDEEQAFSQRRNDNSLIYNGTQLQDNSWLFDNFTTQLYYIKRFAKPGRELSADINYNNSNRKGNSAILTNSFFEDGSPFFNNPLQQEIINTGITDQITFQLDYVNPVGKGRLESGLRVFYKTSQFDNAVNRIIDGQILSDSTLSNQFEILEQVNAAYINYVNANQYFTYQAGFRFEHSYYRGDVLNRETSFFYEYPATLSSVWKAIFPSLFISKKYGEAGEIQFNISRKIGRPGFWHLNPTVNINDPRNLRVGNPELRPEFINLAEINHSLSGKRGTWLATIYGRMTEDPINWVIFPLEEDPDILVSTSLNGDWDFTYGLENIWKWIATKNLDITVGLNTYMVNVVSNTPIGEFRNSGFTYDIKPNITYRFPKDWSVQVSGNYRAPRILPQGETLPYYFMDISMAKKIDKKWSINLIVSDVFNTKIWGQAFDTPFYFQESSRRREARYARLTLSYSFGQDNFPKFRKRIGRSEERGGGDEGGDF